MRPRLFLAHLALVVLVVGCANHPLGKRPAAGPLPACGACQGQWSSFDGTVLPYSRWPLHPPVHPRALVILAQGWDAVCTDYESLGTGLAKAGYVVYTSENRCGMGDPDKRRRGTAPKHWQDWVSDLKAFTRFVQKKHPGLPMFYHGHSMGSIVCMLATAEASGSAKPRGLMVHSAPMPLMSASDRPVLEALFNLFGWVRLPHLRIDPAKVGLTGSTDLNNQWAWSENRVRKGYSLSFLSAAAVLGHEARLVSRSLTLPVLAMAGGKDNIVTSDDREMRDYIAYLSTELAGGHAQFVFFRNGFHTLSEEPTEKQALRVMIVWLDAQTSQIH